MKENEEMKDEYERKKRIEAYRKQREEEKLRRQQEEEEEEEEEERKSAYRGRNQSIRGSVHDKHTKKGKSKKSLLQNMRQTLKGGGGKRTMRGMFSNLLSEMNSNDQFIQQSISHSHDIHQEEDSEQEEHQEVFDFYESSDIFLCLFLWLLFFFMFFFIFT